MSADRLRASLRDCVIGFDRCLYMTQLLDEYELAYDDVTALVEEHLATQEQNGVQFERHYLVQGQEPARQPTEADQALEQQLQEYEKEVLAVVVNEADLRDLLSRLKNAESTLYSVEVAGGARGPPPEFQPMRYSALTLPGITEHNGTPMNHVAGDAEPLFIPEVKEERTPTKPSPKPSAKPSTAAAKVSPAESKPKPADKKGIGKFFANAAAPKETKSKAGTGTGSAVKKPPTPKKMNDFFRKQADKSVPAKVEVKTEDPNQSIQLFDNAEDEVEAMEVPSSDEEEKIDALRRDIVASDHEEDAVGVARGGRASTKRRRIEDSDDDEPQLKHEKKHEQPAAAAAAATAAAVVAEQSAKSATYLDDDGFVMTVKGKKANAKKSPPAKPPVKPSVKDAAPAKPKTAATPAAKTKQGNIMSFFTKK